MQAKDKQSILVLEDETAIRITTASYFESAGYTVYQADSVEAADEILDNTHIDLILSDIQLPGEDGLSLTRRLRAASDVGIILISQRGDEIERIVGLEMGADAYIVKPFNVREVLAYAKNILGRLSASTSKKQGSATTNYYLFDEWRLEIHSRELTNISTNENVSLTRDEFYLLLAFLRNSNQTLSRDQLIDLVHNADWIANDRTVDVLVGRVRKKLGDSVDPKLIVTVYGVGYTFKGDVRQE